MMFHTLSAFIDMGGHGQFVWSAYGISLVVILFNFIRPVVLKKRNEAKVRQQVKSEKAQLASGAEQ